MRGAVFPSSRRRVSSVFSSALVSGCCFGTGAAARGSGFFDVSSEEPAMSDTQLSANQMKLIDLAYTRSCQRLDTQQEIANASDQRALVFSTLSIASSALIFGALNSASGKACAVGSAVFFGVAALSSALSALPQKQYSTGSHAKDLEESIKDDTNEYKVLRGLCVNNDEYIDFNEGRAGARAHFYRFGIFAFIVGILISAIGFASIDLNDLNIGGTP